jgi:hypothetical protein
MHGMGYGDGGHAPSLEFGLFDDGVRVHSAALGGYVLVLLTLFVPE